jgi:hypothetical protein
VLWLDRLRFTPNVTTLCLLYRGRRKFLQTRLSIQEVASACRYPKSRSRQRLLDERNRLQYALCWCGVNLNERHIGLFTVDAVSPFVLAGGQFGALAVPNVSAGAMMCEIRHRTMRETNVPTQCFLGPKAASNKRRQIAHAPQLFTSLLGR